MRALLHSRSAVHRQKFAPEKIELWKNVVDFNAAVAITRTQKKELKKKKNRMTQTHHKSGAN